MPEFRDLIQSCKSIGFHFLEKQPGDALRLIHAVETSLETGETRSPVLIITTRNELKRLFGLFSCTDIICKPAIYDGVSVVEETTGKHKIIWLSLDSLEESSEEPLTKAKIALEYLMNNGLKSNNFLVFHVYLGAEETTQWRNKLILKNTVVFQATRIDKSSLMLRRRLKNFSIPPSISSRIKILLMIRESQNDKWRNTPKAQIEQSISIAEQKNVELYFGGFETEKEFDEYFEKHHLSNGFATLPYVGKSYYEQIEEYSKYDVAVGVNSAVLDMALAAGLTGLRLCEFQRLEPSHWGEWYNWFLSNKLNVGFEPIRKNDDRWYNVEAQEAYKKTLSMLINLLKISDPVCSEAKYLLLPAGFWLTKS